MVGKTRLVASFSHAWFGALWVAYASGCTGHASVEDATSAGTEPQTNSSGATSEITTSSSGTAGDDASTSTTAGGTDTAGHELPVARLSAGVGLSCVIFEGGSIKCWGVGGFLGLGDDISRGGGPGEMGANLPVVDLGASATAESVGCGYYHACALLDGGTVKCWGGNEYGQLGAGDKEDRGDEPGEIGDDLPVVDLGAQIVAKRLAVGPDTTCVITTVGAVKCWGDNLAGTLGLGDTENRGDEPGEMGDALPAVDLGGIAAEDVSVGAQHVCAVLSGGLVKCWGLNALGELGLGDTEARGDEPGEMGDALPAVDLGTGRHAVAVQAGFGTTCALLDDATVKCWGWNLSGELGIGDTLTRGDEPGEMGDALPSVDLGTNRYAVQVSISGFDPYWNGSHVCAVLDDASVKCWGVNAEGQLGQGDTESRGWDPSQLGDALLPLDFGSAGPVASVSVGGAHACVTFDSGRVKCWGNNEMGQLGLGDQFHRGDEPGEMGDDLSFVELW